jgi:sec-independent protein translocase protein TatC
MKTHMGWIDHFEDLRKRIIYTLIFMVVALIASLVFVSHLYQFLLRPLDALHLKLVVVSPGEIVMVFLGIGLAVSIGVSLPFALYQAWKFVSPGLTETERRYTLRLLPIAFVMFLLGICFSWFLLFPNILRFLVELTEKQGATVFLRANSYFSFMTSICLPFGFVFELPIAVIFLTRIGIITPAFLRKIRKFAYLAIVILGVLISPPELVSHLSVVVPMMVLYEISILLSVFVIKRKVKVETTSTTS